MSEDPLYLLAVLSLGVVVSEWLVRRTLLRHFGTALLVILVAAFLANVGVIPTGTAGVALYEGVFGYVAPLGIFWLLLRVQLRGLLAAGGAMIAFFLVGSLGTVAGALAGIWMVGGGERLGGSFHAVAGMFTGTYTGGSANFNAIALQYGVNTEGAVYTGSIAVDNIFTTVWMVATIALPRLLARLLPARRSAGAGAGTALTGIEEDTETLHPIDLGLVFFLGAMGVFLSVASAGWMEAAFGWDVPWVLILTTLALVLAQVPSVARLRGARLLGMFSVYLFLAVIGAYCDFAEFARIGELGLTLLIFAGTVVGVHGLVVFGAGALWRADWDVVAVASQANVGGGTSALALARSLGRADLVLPGILVGSLGTALGTYLGVLVAEHLGS